MQDLPLEQYVRQTLTVFMETKTLYCLQKNCRTDLAQTVDCLVAGQRGISLVPDRAFIVAAVRSMEEAKATRARRIVHLADGFGTSGTELPTVRPRDAFAAGDPAAFECLTAAGIDTVSGELVQMSVRYKYDNDGKGITPVFDEPETMHGAFGLVADILREVAK